MTKQIQSGVARVRLLERHGAASLRALSGKIQAEYRANGVRVQGRATPFAAPYLAVNCADATLQRCRGVVDSLGLRLRHTDLDLHKDLSPVSGFARVLFDVLEQIRCDSLAAHEYQGLRANLDACFFSWCNEAHNNGLCDNQFGVLLYTMIHMVRARMIGTREDATAEALIESTRAELAPLIGAELYQLSALRNNQVAYAKPANRIAQELSTLVAEGAVALDDADTAQDRHAIVLPPDWSHDARHSELESIGICASVASGDTQSDAQLDLLGDYSVFTSEFDSVVSGESLYSAERRKQLRIELDLLVEAQAVSVRRLARELFNLFAVEHTRSWLHGQEDGVVDARRLSQLVSNPQYRHVFMRPHSQLRTNAVVSFLIDNSGSMKRQRYREVAVMVDTYCRALGLAGIASEVLGFTTSDWNGGRAMQAWRRRGSPQNPGRVGETLQIVYKSAGTPWRQSRAGLASMLETRHFREGVDGEALIWAYRRLLQRTEKNRYLIVISDGAPMDAATHNLNRQGFLDDHLLGVVRSIERQRRVFLGGIGIDLDMSNVFVNNASLDLTGNLVHQSYRVLQDLLANSRGRS